MNYIDSVADRLAHVLTPEVRLTVWAIGMVLLLGVLAFRIARYGFAQTIDDIISPRLIFNHDSEVHPLMQALVTVGLFVLVWTMAWFDPFPGHASLAPV